MNAHDGEYAEVRLPHGTVRYRDVGKGPVLVFVHGLLVSGTLWRKVVDRLSDRFRCVVPDLPLGSHRIPMNPDADLSSAGLARLLGDFLDVLGLDDVTLVGNDTGGVVCQLLVTRRPARVGRLVLTTCDAFEVFPPELFAYLRYATYIPGLLAAVGKAMLAVPALHRLPTAYGAIAKHPIDRAVTTDWVVHGARDRRIRRDLFKVIREVSPQVTLDVARELPRFTRPVLLAWTPENPFFPMDLAHRLAKTFPDARLVTIPDAHVFVSEDNPGALVQAIEAFLEETGVDREAGRSRAS